VNNESEQTLPLVANSPASSASRESTLMPWLVWGLAAAYFFFDYVARVSPGVMSVDLMVAFNISAAGLGILSAFFYLPYVAMQIPVGLLVDRFSVRRLLTFMSLLTGLACVLFAMAQHINGAIVARFLIGFSAAFAFVSTLKLASEWFPLRRLGLLAGLTQALGMLGASVGEYPTSYLSHYIGWRHTLLVMAVAFVVLSVLIYFIVRDQPATKKHISRPSVGKMRIWASLKMVLSNSQSWLNALCAGLLFVPTAVFGELWGVTYLTHVRGFSEGTAAAAISLIFIGWGVGGPLTGWLSDRIGRRKPLLLISAACGCVLFLILLYVPHLSLVMTMLLFFIFGMTNTGVAIAYAIATEINPHRVVGTSIAFTNMASICVGAALQPVVGWLLDVLSTGTSATTGHHVIQDPAVFHMAFSLLPVLSALAFICALFVRETNCRQQFPAHS